MSTQTDARDPRPWVAAAAAAAPSLLAYNLSPSPTFLNQALALGLWAAFVLVCASRSPGRGVAMLCAALALVAAGVLWSWGPGALPASLALSALGLLGATTVLAGAGAAARRDAQGATLFAAFASGWVIAGVLNVLVAMVQVFAPGLADGDWIASSNLPGRAVGNLRQPNHLSSLLLWAVIAAVALAGLGALSRRLAAALVALFIFGVVLTASRTGLLSVLLLAAWGALDRRLAPWLRLLLLAAPVLYALSWAGLAQWAEISQRTFGGAVRVAEGAAAGADISSARFAIWSHTLALMRESPWAGVGFGEFNFAWTLTPFEGRPNAFFDHTHNLPLQLAVELGLPLAAAVMTLLLTALWRAARAAWRAGAADPAGIGARAAVLMVLMIGLHSLLEYPLWYAYFLLPAAWAWGFALGEAAPEATPDAAHGARRAASPTAALRVDAARRTAAPHVDATRPAATLFVGAAGIVLGTALAIADYTRVVSIFSSADGETPLAHRIQAGRRSVFFSHHADYAAVTSGALLPDASASFANTTHYLLDSRLMIAWSEWLAAQGRTDLARHLAARLREFRSPDAVEFFAACPGDAGGAAGNSAGSAGAAASAVSSAPAAAPGDARAQGGSTTQPAPFQCLPAQRTPRWREYLDRAPLR